MLDSLQATRRCWRNGSDRRVRNWSGLPGSAIACCKQEDSTEASEDTNVVFDDGTTEPVSSIFKEADGYLKAGILKEPGAADLFKEGGMFPMVWDAQMRGAQTKDEEEKKQRDLHPDLPAKKATGRGMRYNPIMMHWALRLYGQGRAAYRTAMEANPTIPSERYVTLIKTHTP